MNTGERTNKGDIILQGARKKRYFVNAQGHRRYLVNRPPQVPQPPKAQLPELPGTRLILYSGVAKIKLPSLDNRFKMFEQYFRAHKSLPKFFTEVSGRKNLFKTVASITNEYGIKPANPSYGFSAVTIKLFFGDRAHALNLFRNGKITFTGGYPVGTTNVSTTPKQLLNNVFGDIPFELKSITAQVFAKYQPESNQDPQDLAEHFGGTFTKQFMMLKEDGMAFRYYMNGTVQVSGIKSQGDFTDAKKIIGKRVGEMMRAGLVSRGGVRPARVLTRPQRRFTNQAAPDFMTRSTTCPKNRMPVPYSFAGRAPPGFYVSANPQGQPCCYKIPKRVAYLKPKIVQRFAGLGLRIPNSTKQIFGINIDNSNKPVNVSGHVNANMAFVIKKSRTGVDTLKIGTRQAMRYSMTKLVDIARRLGVSLNVRGRAQGSGQTRISKADVAVSILDWAKKHQRLKSHSNKMLNAGRVRLGPGGRLANTYSKQGLMNAAARVGIRVPSNLKLSNMIAYVKERM